MENASKMALIPVSHGIYQDFQSFFLRRRATTLVAILPKQPQAGLVSETGDSVVAQKMSSKCNYHNCRLHLSQLDAFASFATILHHSYPFLTSNLEQLHHHSLLITRRLLDTRHCCSGQRSAKGPRHHRLWCLAFSSVGWCRVSRAWMGIASWPYVYIIIKVFIKVDLKPQEHLTVLGRKPLFGDIWACLLQKCLGPVEFITKNVIVNVRQRLWNHTVFQNE